MIDHFDYIKSFPPVPNFPGLCKVGPHHGQKKSKLAMPSKQSATVDKLFNNTRNRVEKIMIFYLIFLNLEYRHLYRCLYL